MHLLPKWEYNQSFIIHGIILRLVDDSLWRISHIIYLIELHLLCLSHSPARLNLQKPGKSSVESGHALMVCQGHESEPSLPTGRSKTDGNHFWNVLLYSCLLKCKVNPSRNRILWPLTSRPFSMLYYGQSESKLYGQTVLQCAFNKGCYCPGDAE